MRYINLSHLYQWSVVVPNLYQSLTMPSYSTKLFCRNWTLNFTFCSKSHRNSNSKSSWKRVQSSNQIRNCWKVKSTVSNWATKMCKPKCNSVIWPARSNSSRVLSRRAMRRESIMMATRLSTLKEKHLYLAFHLFRIKCGCSKKTKLSLESRMTCWWLVCERLKTYSLQRKTRCSIKCVKCKPKRWNWKMQASSNSTWNKKSSNFSSKGWTWRTSCKSNNKTPAKCRLLRDKKTWKERVWDARSRV